MEVIKEGFFQVLPAADGIFGQAVQLVSGWSFEFEGEVFDGMDIVIASHVNVEKKIFNPYRGIYHSIV